MRIYNRKISEVWVDVVLGIAIVILIITAYWAVGLGLP